jgi:hypothetical protein
LETLPQYAHIASNATFNLKYGAGNLHGIVLNKLATSSANTLTIYDNTSATGTTIAVITNLQGSSTNNSSQLPVFLDYMGLPFSTGLTIVSAGGTVGDYTIIYE